VGKAERATRLRLNKLLDENPAAVLPAGWVKLHVANPEVEPGATQVRALAGLGGSWLP
jgi:hypothetical protein